MTKDTHVGAVDNALLSSGSATALKTKPLSASTGVASPSRFSCACGAPCGSMKLAIYGATSRKACRSVFFGSFLIVFIFGIIFPGKNCGKRYVLAVLALENFNVFDTSTHEGDHDPENFYHGFVLGMVVSLGERYIIESNRESGYGRFDILMEPLNKTTDNRIILEFKVFNPNKEKDLEGTCSRALKQIKEKKYDIQLKKRGVPQERIVHFGIGFKSKEALVRKDKTTGTNREELG